MHDPWMDRLSEYIDGELGAAEAAELERHLAGCADCRVTLAELRSIVAAAGSLEDTPPVSDLWAGIAAGIGATHGGSRTGSPAAAQADVLPLHRDRVVRRTDDRVARRGYSFSAAQLAAAALLLMAFSAAGAWWMAVGRGAPDTAVGTIVHVAGEPAPSSRLASDEGAVVDPSTSEPVREDIAELERTLDTMRGRIDPATADVLERSLESIDQAIAAAQAALEADPGNPHLSRQLDNTMRKKLDILRRAHRVQRAGT